MNVYRGPEGGERIWFEASEIEHIMEDELRRSGLWPAGGTLVVDIERFLEGHLKASLDQYANLEPAVLGLTEFRSGAAPAVRINRDLTGSAMDNERYPPGILGRWRATLAHEAAHVVLHRMLVEGNPDQTSMLGDPTPSSPVLLRCLKREVAYRTGGRDWREVQANRGMAALLMPRGLFISAGTREVSRGIGGTNDPTRRLAAMFGVSREAAGIRLRTLGFREPDPDSELSFPS